MAKRKAAPSADGIEVDVREITGAPAQPFWEKNQKLLTYFIGGLLVLVAAYWGYKILVAGPQEKEAQDAMWQAQVQFDRDSFKLALENPGAGYEGFLALADKYSSTNAGNAAKYYCGVCYLHMGDYDNAITYLEKFSPDGSLLPVMKYGVMGDCYSEKGDFDKAIKMYEKAADQGENKLLSAHYLKKAGMLNEFQGNKAAAKADYERVKLEFVNTTSPDWRDIDKYISRVSEQ
jgi:tetratricopeptide (TPR) repeat protein